MRTLKRTSLLATLPLVALLGFSSEAAAQPGPTDPTLVQAGQAYTEGRGHFDAERFAEALVAFERAYTLRPNPIVLLPIAETQLRLGHVGEAIRRFEQYLRDRPDASDRAQLEQRLTELRARPGTIRVTSTPPGARIRLDGQDVPQRTPAELQAPPGPHTVGLLLPGHDATEQQVLVPPGEGTTAEATLRVTAPLPSGPPPNTEPTARRSSGGQSANGGTEPPVTPPGTPPAEGEGSRSPGTVVWVSTAVAGGALIAGTVLGFLALSDANEYDQLAQTYRLNPSEGTLQQANDVADRGRRYALLADLGFGAALLAASVAVVVYLSDRSSAPAARATTASVEPRWRLTPGGLLVHF